MGLSTLSHSVLFRYFYLIFPAVFVVIFSVFSPLFMYSFAFSALMLLVG